MFAPTEIIFTAIVRPSCAVKVNKGSPGVDGMTVDELPEYLKQHGLEIGEQLRNGTYRPQPVRRVEIPKPDGSGMRKLGIPSSQSTPVLGVTHREQRCDSPVAQALSNCARVIATVAQSLHSFRWVAQFRNARTLPSPLLWTAQNSPV